MKKLLAIFAVLFSGILLAPAPTYYYNRYSTNVDGTYIPILATTITNITFLANGGVVSNYGNVFGVNQTNTGNIQAQTGVFTGTGPATFSGGINMSAKGITNNFDGFWGNAAGLTNLSPTTLRSPTNAMGSSGALDFAVTTPGEVTTNIGSSSFTIGGIPTGGDATAYNTKIVHVLSSSGTPTITVAAPWKSLGNGGSLTWTCTNRVDLIFTWQFGQFTNVTGISDATIVTGSGTALSLSGNSLNVVSTPILTNGFTGNIAFGGGETNNSAGGFNGNAAGLTNHWIKTLYFGGIHNIQLQNGNRFVPLFGASTATNLAHLVTMPLPSGGYISNLTVRCSTNNFSTTNYAFTILTNSMGANPVAAPVASLVTGTLLGATAVAFTNIAAVSLICPTRTASFQLMGCMQILNSVANTTQPQSFTWEFEHWVQYGNP